MRLLGPASAGCSAQSALHRCPQNHVSTTHCSWSSAKLLPVGREPKSDAISRMQCQAQRRHDGGGSYPPSAPKAQAEEVTPNVPQQPVAAACLDSISPYSTQQNPDRSAPTRHTGGSRSLPASPLPCQDRLDVCASGAQSPAGLSSAASAPVPAHSKHTDAVSTSSQCSQPALPMSACHTLQSAGYSRCSQPCASESTVQAIRLTDAPTAGSDGSFSSEMEPVSSRPLSSAPLSDASTPGTAAAESASLANEDSSQAPDESFATASLSDSASSWRASPPPRTPRRRGNGTTALLRPLRPSQDPAQPYSDQQSASSQWPASTQLPDSNRQRGSDEDDVLLQPQLRPPTPPPQHLVLEPTTADTGSHDAHGNGRYSASDSGWEDNISQSASQPETQARIPVVQPMVLVPADPDRYPLLWPDDYKELCWWQSADRGTPQQLAVRREKTPPGAQPGVVLPLLGPFVLTNSPRVWRHSDAAVNYLPGPVNIPSRLAVRLEYVVQRQDHMESAVQAALQGDAAAQEQVATNSYSQQPLTASLQLYNISRTRRGAPRRYANVLIESPSSPGQEPSDTHTSAQDAQQDRAVKRTVLRPGDAAVALQPGDVIVFGITPDAPRFRVQLLQPSPGTGQLQLPCPIETALRRYGRRKYEPDADLPTSLQGLAQLARTAPRMADAGYRAACSGTHQHNPFAWLAWAQLSVRRGYVRQARTLFRAAVAMADPALHSSQPPAQADSDLSHGLASSDDSSGNVTDSQSASGPQAPVTATTQHVSTDHHSGNAIHNPTLQPAASWVPVHASPVTDQGLQPDADTDSAVVALLQALYTWGRFEWNHSRLRGAARHLWRAAADIAHLHSSGPAAGGLGLVVHTWAVSELDMENVYNARVVVAKGLRKCPLDAALFVLAANVELQGGNPELAREFCLRACELDRTHKQLYIVWPQVMAALREPVKARVLFERGLEYHPRNTKLLSAYATFEAEIGDIEYAKELQERALAIDNTSLTSMHNRAALARLEADTGDLRRAKQLLEEGLQMFPTHVTLLLGLARVQRLSGEWSAAQATLRAAKIYTHDFNTELIKERAQLWRALGERAMATALEAHLRGVTRMVIGKRRGLSTQEAWQQYFAEARYPVRQQLAQAALSRKLQLAWLQSAGVVGPRGARRPSSGHAQGVPWVPLPDPPAAVYTSPGTDDTGSVSGVQSGVRGRRGNTVAWKDVDTGPDEDTPSPMLPDVDVEWQDDESVSAGTLDMAAGALDTLMSDLELPGGDTYEDDTESVGDDGVVLNDAMTGQQRVVQGAASSLRARDDALDRPVVNLGLLDSAQ